MIIHAASQAELERISSVLHDCWFDVESLVHDIDKHTLLIPFPRGTDRGRPARKSSVVPVQAIEVEIRNVEEVALLDSEKIGLYDLNRFCYLPGTRSIRIETGVPLNLQVVVTHLELVMRLVE